MGEIKFRGRDADGIKEDTGKWVYGTPGYGNGDGKTYINRGGRLYAAIEVDPDTIGQFTGLKDKNGTEIYEGDYLRYTRANWECHGHPENGTDLTHCCLVYWSDEKHGFCNDVREGNSISGRVFSSGPLGFNDPRADECIIEVIGNIHKDPELIESK